MATACAMVKRSSTVMILPLERMRSGGGCCARRIAANNEMMQTARRILGSPMGAEEGMDLAHG